MEKFDPKPQIKDGKMARFGSRPASSLISGDGVAVSYYSVQDWRGVYCTLHTHPTLLDKMDGTLRPPIPSAHIKEGKMARFGFRADSFLISFFIQDFSV